VEAVANALDVGPATLLGQPFVDSPDGQAIAAGVRRIRRALTDTSLVYGSDVTPRSVPALRAEGAEATRLRMAADYLGLGRLLPPLIRELHALHTDREALELFGPALGAASHMLTVTGAYAESLLASDRRQAAAELLGDDRELAGIEWSRAHALIPDGSTFIALRATTTAAEAIPHTPDNLPTFGALLLVSSYAAAVRGEVGEADARLTEALDVAARTGETGPPYAFGVTNVHLHRMAAGLEAGNAEASLRVGQAVNPRRIAVAERRAMFFVDLGRSYAYNGHAGDAVKAFSAAERVAPHRAHTNPFARDAIAELLDNARRVAGGPALQGLAARYGVAS
jgi:hypothetical protein